MASERPLPAVTSDGVRLFGVCRMQNMSFRNSVYVSAAFITAPVVTPGTQSRFSANTSSNALKPVCCDETPM